MSIVRGLSNECKKLWNKKKRKFIRTSLLMVQSESNLLKMFHIEKSQMSTI